MRKRERKYSRRPRWLWPALAATVVVWIAGIVLILAREERRAPATARTGIHPSIDSGVTMLASSTKARATAVERLRAFVVRSETMKDEHNYTSIGLRRLADAIEGLAGREHAALVAPQCASLRAAAERLQSDSASSARAQTARRAFIDAVAAIGQLRRGHYLDRDSLAVQIGDAAREIDPDVGLLEQRARVRRAFSSAYSVIDAMARERP